ncbi:MAG: hypothetical protein Q7J85_00960 [Bacillota bacterium]|nr:hypothetical protein [Bacillota bacterium]
MSFLGAETGGRFHRLPPELGPSLRYGDARTVPQPPFGSMLPFVFSLILTPDY